MAAADDVRNYETGENPSDPTGFEQGWISRLRNRKVLSDNVNKQPFTRSWPGGQTVGSPMEQDKLTAIADATGWRAVNAVPEGVPSMPTVVDVGDILDIWWNYFKLIADPAILEQAIQNAKAFPPWPAGYPGAVDWDK